MCVCVCVECELLRMSISIIVPKVGISLDPYYMREDFRVQE